MTRKWVGLAVLAGLGLAGTGCYHTPVKRVKRPDLVQEYQLPPQDDLRFSRPPALPTKVLLDDQGGKYRNTDNPAKDLQAPMMQSTSMGGRGGMP